MSEIERSTERHYGQTNLTATILAALRRQGKDVNNLTPEDLAPVDAFHVRGRAATQELGRLAALEEGQRVLEVGCGLGGSARYLAMEFGCSVTGLDLTREYIDAATELTRLLSLQEQVDFHCGSALEMPFEDAAYDAAWSEHAQMNIADKPRLYSEIHRVLKTGGKFVFHDILQGKGGDPHFPTPWASEPSFSSLITPEKFRSLLQSLGFDIHHWEDITTVGRTWFRERVAAMKESGPPPLGFQTLIGSIAPETQETNLRNLEENRIALFQGVVEKVG